MNEFWKEGYLAYFSLRNREENPFNYNEEYHKWNIWNQGWDEASYFIR